MSTRDFRTAAIDQTRTRSLIWSNVGGQLSKVGKGERQILFQETTVSTVEANLRVEYHAKTTQRPSPRRISSLASPIPTENHPARCGHHPTQKASPSGAATDTDSYSRVIRKFVKSALDGKRSSQPNLSTKTVKRMKSVEEASFEWDEPPPPTSTGPK